jgi:hypothetical protein
MLWPMGVTNESSEFISNLYQHRRRESCGKTVQRTIREHIDIWSAFPRGIADVEHIPVLFHSTILKVIQGQYISMSVCTAHQSFFISASLEFKRRSLFKFYLLRTNVLNTELLVKLGAFSEEEAVSFAQAKIQEGKHESNPNSVAHSDIYIRPHLGPAMQNCSSEFNRKLTIKI